MKSIIKQLYTILLVTVACLTVAGCSDDFKSNLRLDGDVWVNSIKLDEYAGTIDYQNKTIVVGVPYDYDVTRMAVSEINLSEGATASIAVGETIDFSLPVSLTVKNGDVQMNYTITVKRDEAKILTFKLNDTYVGKVDQLSKTISVVVPLTVDITQLKGTHRTGLKVIIDFVPNHVARQYHSDAQPDGTTELGANDDPNQSFSPYNNFYYIPQAELRAQFDMKDGAAEPYREFPAKATGNNRFDALWKRYRILPERFK